MQNKLFVLHLYMILIQACTCKMLNGLNGSRDQKGIMDWITDWISDVIGGDEDPPENCPACQCGVPFVSQRIVGGHETKVLQFPWMAELQKDGRFFCGGSLINDLYVLTAAHCTIEFVSGRIKVILREHKRSTPNETNIIQIKVKKIIRHPLYNPENQDNDIALLKLNERVPITNAYTGAESTSTSDSSSYYTERDDSNNVTWPVCMPDPELLYVNYTAIVTGWGRTKEGGQVSDTLQMVEVPIMSNEECQKLYNSSDVTENMMCAGVPEGGKDSCQGDSGGPLHIMDKSNLNAYKQAGVVSWGKGCARPNQPGVYTRVNKYMDWISENTKDACYCNSTIDLFNQ